MTIKDLAKKTGYGVATVSRVLNGQPSVSETARSVILRAAEESGFQLNSNAKHPDARPNLAHEKLAQWEREGRLLAVVTQNIDGHAMIFIF